jgi:Zn-finger nucleic acid-binding protein
MSPFSFPSLVGQSNPTHELTSAESLGTASETSPLAGLAAGHGSRIAHSSLTSWAGDQPVTDPQDSAGDRAGNASSGNAPGTDSRAASSAAGGASAAAVRLTGQATGVACPHCHQETEFAHVLKLKVVACPACHGFLAQSKDFAGLVAAVRSHFRGKESVQRFEPAEMQVRRQCPTCGKTMETHPYAGPGSVVVDSCSPCQTVWLDGGELERIERAPGRR